MNEEKIFQYPQQNVMVEVVEICARPQWHMVLYIDLCMKDVTFLVHLLHMPLISMS